MKTTELSKELGMGPAQKRIERVGYALRVALGCRCPILSLIKSWAINQEQGDARV